MTDLAALSMDGVSASRSNGSPLGVPPATVPSEEKFHWVRAFHFARGDTRIGDDAS